MGVCFGVNFPRSCQVVLRQKIEYLNNNKYPAMQFLARPFLMRYGYREYWIVCSRIPFSS